MWAPCIGARSCLARGLGEAQWALACLGLAGCVSLGLACRAGKCWRREKPAVSEVCPGWASENARSAAAGVAAEAVAAVVAAGRAAAVAAGPAAVARIAAIGMAVWACWVAGVRFLAQTQALTRGFVGAARSSRRRAAKCIVVVAGRIVARGRSRGIPLRRLRRKRCSSVVCCVAVAWAIVVPMRRQ